MDIEQVARQVSERLQSALPPQVGALREEIKRNLIAVLKEQLTKMDWVSREEFDVQSAVLARTRQRLDTLEQQLAELEQKLGARS
ncbi:MAG TPA: accessory factor UbiK family protein [Pseudomonadales bacterium]|nr:accessory factor UbiK family protein [Pseudomonadales bacterium]